MSHSDGRIQYLDGWRGLSILAVLIGHFLIVPGIELGPFGVEMFFVLSGRLMAEILFEREFPLPQFYQRRFSRVYPGLFVFVVLSFLALRFDWLSALRALTFTLNYLGTDTHDLDHIWSLCVEEHAYVVLGFLAFLVRRFRFNPAPVLWVLGGLSMADGFFGSAVLQLDWYQAYWRTDAHVGSIFCSAALYLNSRNWRSSQMRSWAIIPLGLLAVVLNLSVVPDYIKYSAGTLTLAYAVNNLRFSDRRLQSLLSLRPATYLGTISFSVYLWQQPFYQMSFGHNKLYGLGLLLISVAVGALSFAFVEQPARKGLNRLAQRVSRRREPAPAIR